MNSWIATCENLQWAGALPLAALLCILDRDSNDLKFREALADRQAAAERNAGPVAVAVAGQMELKLQEMF